MLTQSLDYFLEIVECGGLKKAAEKLHVSQPSLSQYIKRLERGLNADLFNHKTSPLKLTYAGECYHAYALQLREMDKNIRKEIAEIQNQVNGRLRLGVALWRGACLLPDVYPAFHQAYPAIHLELLEGRFERLKTALLNDSIDLAVAPIPRSINFDQLFYDILSEERIFLAAPTHHPYVQDLLSRSGASETPLTIGIEIFSKIPVILTKPGQNLTYEAQRFFAKHHITPDILLDTDNLTTAINLVAEGIACTFVPEEGAKICQRTGKVTFFIVDTQDLVWDLVAVYKKGAYLNNISKIFIDFVKNRLKNA